MRKPRIPKLFVPFPKCLDGFDKYPQILLGDIVSNHAVEKQPAMDMDWITDSFSVPI